MGIKGDDVADSHIRQLLKSKSTVQRFPFRPFVLAAFIKERHDHVDTVCLAVGCGDDSFQVLIVIVRRHVVQMTVDGVGQTVVADVHHDKQVCAADRLA